jgi:hypothetical protein
VTKVSDSVSVLTVRSAGWSVVLGSVVFGSAILAWFAMRRGSLRKYSVMGIPFLVPRVQNHGFPSSPESESAQSSTANGACTRWHRLFFHQFVK